MRETGQYKLVSQLSCMPLPDDGPSVNSPDDLLQALVNGSDNSGRYFANPCLLRGLFWWDETDAERVKAWRDDLVKRGDVEIKPIGRSVYGGAAVDIICIRRPRRFPRFAPRSYIPIAVRKFVYERDGRQCIWCAATEPLSLDHIVPVSKGGSDRPENLQTLCQSCNCKKHNADDHVGRERAIGGKE